MSYIGTVANYGGKQSSNSQSIKEFIIGVSGAVPWIYSKLPSGLKVITPSDSKKPVYINNDLIVQGSLFNTSDANLKDNIIPISEINKNKLLSLQAKEYYFKADITKKIHYGFVAQDVEKLYPTLVKENVLGYKTVNYIEFIPILVSKIQDMQNEIIQLKEKISILSDSSR
jgi:hypothetical protein